MGQPIGTLVGNKVINSRGAEPHRGGMVQEKQSIFRVTRRPKRKVPDFNLRPARNTGGRGVHLKQGWGGDLLVDGNSTKKKNVGLRVAQRKVTGNRGVTDVICPTKSGKRPKSARKIKIPPTSGRLQRGKRDLHPCKRGVDKISNLESARNYCRKILSTT